MPRSDGRVAHLPFCRSDSTEWTPSGRKPGCGERHRAGHHLGLDVAPHVVRRRGVVSIGQQLDDLFDARYDPTARFAYVDNTPAVVGQVTWADVEVEPLVSMDEASGGWFRRD